jgi:hypothetical protein
VVKAPVDAAVASLLQAQVYTAPPVAKAAEFARRCWILPISSTSPTADPAADLVGFPALHGDNGTNGASVEAVFPFISGWYHHHTLGVLNVPHGGAMDKNVVVKKGWHCCNNTICPGG